LALAYIARGLSKPDDAPEKNQADNPNRILVFRFAAGKCEGRKSVRTEISDASVIKFLKRMPLSVTPDVRYFVVKGRLWRCTNPDLPDDTRQHLVVELMKARRQKGAALRAKDEVGIEAARAAIDAAKRKLGERGDVWWTDGARDWNRHLVKNTPYAEWFKENDGK
jgi:hypothetical protein